MPSTTHPEPTMKNKHAEKRVCVCMRMQECLHTITSEPNVNTIKASKLRKGKEIQLHKIMQEKEKEKTQSENDTRRNKMIELEIWRAPMNMG